MIQSSREGVTALEFLAREGLGQVTGREEPAIAVTAVVDLHLHSSVVDVDPPDEPTRPTTSIVVSDVDLLHRADVDDVAVESACPETVQGNVTNENEAQARLHTQKRLP